MRRWEDLDNDSRIVGEREIQLAHLKCGLSNIFKLTKGDEGGRDKRKVSQVC